MHMCDLAALCDAFLLNHLEDRAGRTHYHRPDCNAKSVGPAAVVGAPPTLPCVTYLYNVFAAVQFHWPRETRRNIF